MQFKRFAAALAHAAEAPARAAQPIPGHRHGRCARHLPARHGGRRHAERVAAFARRTLEQQGGRAPSFRRELKAAGRGHGHALGLADHGTKPPVAQPVFHQREQFGIVARLRIDHALGVEPCLVQPGREQVARAHRPQNRPSRPGGDAGHEQHRRGVVAPARTLPRNLMQRVDSEPLARQPFVDRGNAERQHRTALPAIAFDGAQCLSQLGNRWC